ncbi:hypothetical protein J0H58_21660 [bacterium]|nr:hypothetical protein [bacterium]
MPDLDADAIAANAALPASAGVDGRTAAQVPIADQIKAHQYAAANAAAAGTNENGGKRSGWGMLRTARAVPPGAV